MPPSNRFKFLVSSSCSGFTTQASFGRASSYVSINGTTSTSFQEQLSPEERKSVSLLAYSIKKAVNEVRSATSNHTHVGRLADDFLSELEHDEA
jgi:hypothetical protein